MSKEALILLVDDHPEVRHGLRVLAEKEKDLKVVGEADDGIIALNQEHPRMEQKEQSLEETEST